jgi:hypothetical protein
VLNPVTNRLPPPIKEGTNDLLQHTRHHISKLTEPQSSREFHFPQRRDRYYRSPSSISIFAALSSNCSGGEQLLFVLSHPMYADFLLSFPVGLAPSRHHSQTVAPPSSPATMDTTPASAQNRCSSTLGSFPPPCSNGSSTTTPLSMSSVVLHGEL